MEALNMATVDKDFKVKNGLAVANGGTFGGAVTVGAPTLANHAATKTYVDALLATFADTSDLKQHIHDTAIDGTGLIVSIFQDGGYYDTMFSSEQDAGFYNFNAWAMEWDGGFAIDNFN
jgi:hypothetical protein